MENKSNKWVLAAVVVVVVLVGVLLWRSRVAPPLPVVSTGGGSLVPNDPGRIAAPTSDEWQGVLLAGTKASPLLEFNRYDYERALASGQLVALYFYADWCPLCRKEFSIMQSVWSAWTGEPIIGFRVNYKDDQTAEEEESLAREFGVTYQHTKVFLRAGEVLLKNGTTWDVAKYKAELARLSVTLE